MLAPNLSRGFVLASAWLGVDRVDGLVDQLLDRRRQGTGCAVKVVTSLRPLSPPRPPRVCPTVRVRARATTSARAGRIEGSVGSGSVGVWSGNDSPGLDGHSVSFRFEWRDGACASKQSERRRRVPGMLNRLRSAARTSPVYRPYVKWKYRLSPKARRSFFEGMYEANVGVMPRLGRAADRASKSPKHFVRNCRPSGTGLACGRCLTCPAATGFGCSTST